MRMSGCRVNMFVMPVQVCFVFTGASYSQNKPFGVHEQIMKDKVKVKYVGIISITCHQTKPLRIPKKYVKLACTNYKGLHNS